MQQGRGALERRAGEPLQLEISGLEALRGQERVDVRRGADDGESVAVAHHIDLMGHWLHSGELGGNGALPHRSRFLLLGATSVRESPSFPSGGPES